MIYLFGIFLILLGTFMVWKTDLMIRAFGRNDWAEMKFGGGGTWTFYKLLGVVLILLAFLLMSGDLVGILDFIFRLR